MINSSIICQPCTVLSKSKTPSVLLSASLSISQSFSRYLSLSLSTISILISLLGVSFQIHFIFSQRPFRTGSFFYDCQVSSRAISINELVLFLGHKLFFSYPPHTHALTVWHAFVGSIWWNIHGLDDDGRLTEQNKTKWTERLNLFEEFEYSDSKDDFLSILSRSSASLHPFSSSPSSYSSSSSSSSSSS